MPRFTDRPLAILGRLYAFVGGYTGPQEVDSASGIQMVHDVAREVELSDRGLTALGPSTVGEFVISARLTEVGAGATADFIPVYAANSTFTARMSPRGIDALKFTVWVLGIDVQVSVENLVECYVSVDQSSSNVGGGDIPVPTNVVLSGLLYHATAEAGNESFAGAGFPCIPAMRGPFPFPLYNKGDTQSPLVCLSELSGAGDTEFAIRCVALPLGVTP